MPIYTSTIELNVSESLFETDVKALEYQIEKAILKFQDDLDNGNIGSYSDVNVRVSNLYKENVYIPPTLKE